MLLMVPNNDCRILLSIIGARKTRDVLHRGLGLGTGKFLVGTKVTGLVAGNGPAPEARGRSRQSSRRRLGAVVECQLDGVVADILRPRGDQIGKSPTVIREQGARGFLEARQIA